MAIDAGFFGGLLAVIGINLVLAGDNAVVIALAARSVPPHLQRKAVIYGALFAVILRIILTIAVALLLQIPYLMLIGGMVLIRVAWQLALEEQHEDEDVDAADDLRGAIVTILVADVVMSLDNVLAVAGAAKSAAQGSTAYLLIAIGLLISIPIVMGGASLLLALVKRYPIFVWIGSLLVAYTAFELMSQEEAVHHWLSGWVYSEWGIRALSAGLGLLVIALAYIRRNQIKTKPLLKVEGATADD